MLGFSLETDDACGGLETRDYTGDWWESDQNKWTTKILLDPIHEKRKGTQYSLHRPSIWSFPFSRYVECCLYVECRMWMYKTQHTKPPRLHPRQFPQLFTPFSSPVFLFWNRVLSTSRFPGDLHCLPACLPGCQPNEDTIWILDKMNHLVDRQAMTPPRDKWHFKIILFSFP